jgi:aminotransferase EvaB
MKPMIPLFSAIDANAGLDFRAAVGRVIDSHWYVMGGEVAAFEREFAQYCGASHCVSLGNGTDALELGLRALGVGAGDTVFMAANAGFYGSTAAHLIGAVPRYVDIDPASLTLSPQALAAALEAERPKAIIATHLYGQLADIEAILEVAGRAGVPVIEDVAQAHGARRNGRLAGTFAALGTFSFYPTKNLGALGDGGAVVTNDPAIAARIAQLRQYGWGRKYSVDVPRGRNSRLDEMQAAILREKLPHLDRWNAQRRAIATRYNAAFADLGLACPMSVGDDYVAHLYVVRLADREAFREHLKAEGVSTDVHYPIADHRQPAYAGQGAGFPLQATESACDDVVTLPCYPGMSESDAERVVNAVRRWFARAGAASC